MTMRRGARRVLFALTAVVTACVATVAAFFALDLYVHKRAERSAGLNIWGYRGPVLSRKHPGEIRVVVLGGSTVFGYGRTWQEAFPPQLEQRLNQAAKGPATFTVANLGYNSEGAYAFRFTLEDFAYLEPDVVCLYEGYNDLMGDPNGGNPAVHRHRSPLFRAVGYFPILPLVLTEKAMAIRFGGDLNQAYLAKNKTVFTPTLAARATSGALDAAAAITDSLERQLARAAGAPRSGAARATDTGCASPWTMYCRDVAAAIDYALSRGQRVLFVSQPYLPLPLARAAHIEQQQMTVAMLERRYPGRRDIVHVNVGDAVDLNDRTLAFDGMHLTAEGNARVAARLVQPVLDVMRDRLQASAR